MNAYNTNSVNPFLALILNFIKSSTKILDLCSTFSKIMIFSYDYDLKQSNYKV